MNPVSINFAGDLFLGHGVELQAKENPGSLFDIKILDLFATSDLNIVNLESPLSNASDEHRVIKDGPNIKASPETIGALKILNVNLVTLANNHLYDYGDKGLSDTLELCKNNNIDTVGAGLTLAQASEMYFKKVNDLTIGFINIAENEESNANDYHGGANPMNLIANTRVLHAAKKISDVVILIIHGGHELCYYPSPRIVDQYHYYAEEGASLILSHHSHCVSGYEIYKKVPIFYGLGNLLFDHKTDFEGWYEGVILSIQINMQKEISWKLHPYKQCKDNISVELLEGSEKMEVENRIKSINDIIEDPIKLRIKFNDLVDSKRKFILSIYSTSYVFRYKFLRAVIRKLKLEYLFLRRNQLKSILNYSRCESHRDITLEVIDNYINSK